MKPAEERSNLAKNLIFLRKKHGLTQAALAKLAKVSHRVIAYYETKALKPSYKNIKALSDALNVTVEELMGSQENKISKKIKYNFADIDSRTLNRFKQILSLSKNERHMLYAFLDSLLNKKQKVS